MSLAQALALTTYILLIVIEIVLSVRKNLKLYRTTDTVINLSLGAFTSITKLLIKGTTIAFFTYISQHFAIWHIPANSWLGILALLLLNDLIFYAYHRMSHETRLFWAMHVAHHSSKHFNFSTAIRGNFVHFLYRFVFWAPLAVIGFDPFLILLIDEIGFFYQMFIHTKTVYKFPRWIEFIFNTPSHHRVHHASNEKYLDKNYGAIFIIWDRIFGTFTEETERAKYGLTKDLENQNVVNVITHELVAIAEDTAKARSWQAKLKYIFGKPGWKPTDEEIKINA